MTIVLSENKGVPGEEGSRVAGGSRDSVKGGGTYCTPQFTVICNSGGLGAGVVSQYSTYPYPNIRINLSTS